MLWIFFVVVFAAAIISLVLFLIPDNIEIKETGYFTNVADAEYRQGSEETVTIKGTVRGKFDFNLGLHYVFTGDIIFEKHPDMSLSFDGAVLEKNTDYSNGTAQNSKRIMSKPGSSDSDDIIKGNMLLIGNIQNESGEFKRTDYDIFINKEQDTINIYLSFIETKTKDGKEIDHTYYFDGGANSYDEMDFLYHIKPD